MSYGFSIRADEDVVAQMRRITTAVEQMRGQVENATKQVEKDFKDMGETTREVARMIGEVFAIREAYEFGKELMHITAEFESFNNVIKYSSRSAIDAQDNISYLEGAITRLHMPMREAYQGFSEMQAGLIGTGIEGERLRKLFEGISTAASVLHLPAHSLEMVLYDFKEIGERGLNMRNMRSLMGWLPGISEIVKETFHKTFQELESEHMAGPEFLAKLSGGLQRHFAPGLTNAGNSLQAAMNDTQSALQRLEREMGENLRPLFIEIMKDVRAAFNSDIIRFFVNNIKPIVSGLLTLVKLWAEYKAGIYAVKLIEEARIAVLSAMALAQGQMTIATEEGARSLKGFQEGLNNFQTGLFAMGIGAAIELLMKFREHAKHAQEAYDNMLADESGINKITESTSNYDDDMTKIKGAMADTTLMKDKKYRDDLYGRTQSLMSQMTQNMREVIRPTVDSARARTDSVVADPFVTQADKLERKRLLHADDLAEGAANQQINQLKEIQALLKKAGARPPVYQATGAEGVAGGALSTVGLAGAQGGLGQAKEIHIHIDTMQKVSVGTPDGLKRAGQDAVEVMLRTLNNIAYGQSRTQ